MTDEEKDIINKLERIKVNITGKIYNFESARILNLLNNLQKENEVLKKQEKRTVIFIDSQIRCFDRKIKNILSIKKERRLSERERRTIKYLVGKKDECEKIKSKINKLKEN